MKQINATEVSGAIGFAPAGVIFDVDDTLLSNYPLKAGLGLHERARLYALHEIGKKYGIVELATVSQEINRDVIKRAKEHTVEGGVWQLFYELGIVESDEIDVNNKLLQAVTARKHELYDPIMKEFGAPLPRAVEFVKAVYILTNGNIAIASGAQHSNVMTFLKMTGLGEYFLAERIICSRHISRAKPDPEAFDLAFASLGLPETARPQVIAFEDDPKGIASAKGAGLFAAAITSRFDAQALHSYSPAPDLVRASYIEFAEALGITL